MPAEALTGRRFGRVVVLHRIPGPGRVRWRYLCDCGQERDVKADVLKRDDGHSCGCFQAEQAALTMQINRIDTPLGPKRCAVCGELGHNRRRHAR